MHQNKGAICITMQKQKRQFLLIFCGMFGLVWSCSKLTIGQGAKKQSAFALFVAACGTEIKLETAIF